MGSGKGKNNKAGTLNPFLQAEKIKMAKELQAKAGEMEEVTEAIILQIHPNIKALQSHNGKV